MDNQLLRQRANKRGGEKIYGTCGFRVVLRG
jgi:hypothetical protein